MLKHSLIHPEIMSVLAHCGHGDRILIADGNYPLASKSGGAVKVYLGLTEDMPKVTDVLKVLHDSIAIEGACVMTPPENEDEPAIFREFRDELDCELEGLDRWDFYARASEDDVILAISTGEKRVYANILLTVGVV